MSDNPLNRFLDKFEEVLDATIPAGRLGVAALPTTDHDDKPGLVWHFALYKRGLVCDSSVEVKPAQYNEKVPRGGSLNFCRKCIVKAVEALKDG